jgi:RNA polymerase sigma-70 factor, ECF subfamily
MDFFPFDDEYVRRLRDGDRLTEDHFVSYFTPILRMKVRSRLRRPEAIDDVVQETFFRVLKNLRGAGGREIRDGRRFGAYAARVCDNVILESNRGDKRTQPIDDADLVNLITRETREDELINEQRQACVRRLVSGMKTRDGQILTAIFFSERSKAEACQEFNVDQGYLRVLLHRAREKFREAWEKEQTPERHDSDETDPHQPSLPN